MTRPNKLKCLYLAINFQSCLTFAGNTRSLWKKIIWKVFQLGLLWPCPQILRPDWKEFPRANPLAYWASSSVAKEKSFITLTPVWSSTQKLPFYWSVDVFIASPGHKCFFQLYVMVIYVLYFIENSAHFFSRKWLWKFACSLYFVGSWERAQDQVSNAVLRKCGWLKHSWKLK